MATSSAGSAHVPGTSRPSGVWWERLREIEYPKAPASTASDTRRIISACWSSVRRKSGSQEASPAT